jgi:hypothetical protein
MNKKTPNFLIYKKNLILQRVRSYALHPMTRPNVANNMVDEEAQGYI